MTNQYDHYYDAQPFMPYPAISHKNSHNYENSNRPRGGTGSLLNHQNKNYRVSSELKSNQNQNSIFNYQPYTNYEEEKSEHMEMDLSLHDNDVSMGANQCLLD